MHNFPARFKAASGKFKFNIISATNTTPGSKPIVTFSVTDPTNGDQPYDITADPHFTEIASGISRLAVSIGWNTNAKRDFGNVGTTANFGQPISIDALASPGAGSAAGTYTVTSPVAIPWGRPARCESRWTDIPRAMSAPRGPHPMTLLCFRGRPRSLTGYP